MKLGAEAAEPNEEAQPSVLQVVVVGGGYIGMEVASGLNKNGARAVRHPSLPSAPHALNKLVNLQRNKDVCDRYSSAKAASVPPLSQAPVQGSLGVLSW